MSDPTGPAASSPADEQAQARARIADLSSRLEEAALEVIAQRDRAEASMRDLEEARAELVSARRDLDLIHASRSYQLAERLRRLLRR
jgi:hypothetical protein